jgi:hypothetical protein
MANKKAKNLSKYDITANQHEALLKSQNFKCAICEEAVDTICIDHDHKTGRVRGGLCGRCNSGLGFFRDNPEFLEKAKMYLAKPPADSVLPPQKVHLKVTLFEPSVKRPSPHDGQLRQHHEPQEDPRTQGLKSGPN